MQAKQPNSWGLWSRGFKFQAICSQLIN